MISSVRNLAFRPRFSFCVNDAGRLQVASEDKCTTFAGRAFIAVAPLLDGGRTAEDIVRELQQELPAEQVWYALFTLQGGGFAAEVESALPRQEAAYWDYFDVRSSFALERLSRSTCAILEIGDDSRGVLANAFAENGIGSRPDQKRVLVLVDSYLNPELDQWGKEARNEASNGWLRRPPGPECGWVRYSCRANHFVGNVLPGDCVRMALMPTPRRHGSQQPAALGCR